MGAYSRTTSNGIVVVAALLLGLRTASAISFNCLRDSFEEFASPKVRVRRTGALGENYTVKYYQTGRSLQELRQENYGPTALSLEELHGKTVYDIGAGQSQAVEALRASGVEAYGLDLKLTADQAKLPYYLERDALQTGLPAASADFIYSTFSIVHYEGANSALMTRFFGEMHRILKPGGKIRLSPLATATTAVKSQSGFRIVRSSATTPSDTTKFGWLELERID